MDYWEPPMPMTITTTTSNTASTTIIGGCGNDVLNWSDSMLSPSITDGYFFDEEDLEVALAQLSDPLTNFRSSAPPPPVSSCHSFAAPSSDPLGYPFPHSLSSQPVYITHPVSTSTSTSASGLATASSPTPVPTHQSPAARLSAPPLLRRRSSEPISVRVASGAVSPGPEDDRRRAFSLGSRTAPKSDPSSSPRQCACCGNTNTPMWREGRHNARLCNACGIRWHKYGISCMECNYVPRKNERGTQCPQCSTNLPPPEPTRRQRTISTSSLPTSSTSSAHLADLSHSVA